MSTRYGYMVECKGTVPNPYPIARYIVDVLNRITRDGRHLSKQEWSDIAHQLARRHSRNTGRTMYCVYQIRDRI